MARRATFLLALVWPAADRAAAQVPGQAAVQPGPAVPLVLQLPDMDRIAAHRDLIYRRIGDTLLKADLYVPQRRTSHDPAVIFISGASDFRSWRAFQDLARLAAVNGIVGINFSKRFERNQILEGGEDLQTLLRFLLEKADSLGVDPERVCLWGVSGGGTLLGVGIASPQIRCIVGLYSFVDIRQLLTRFPEGVRDSARRLLSAVDLLDGLPASPPMLLVRAGLDQPLLNASIDSLVRHALDRNRSVELVNYPTGHHAFDLVDDTEESRAILRRAMQFVSYHLRESPGR